MRRLKTIKRIILGILRELSDEGAYRRHLAARGHTHSREEWQEFSRVHFRAKYMQSRCC